jgi:hypothetical protein
LSDFLELIPSIVVLAIAVGLRYLLTPQHRREGGNWVLWWRVPGDQRRAPHIPELKGNDEQLARLAEPSTIRQRAIHTESGQAGEPTRSRSKPADALHRTPMYEGRPARLWCLPEQEIPGGHRDAVRGTKQGRMVCPTCSQSNPVDSAFCSECGTSLTTRAASATRNG